MAITLSNNLYPPIVPDTLPAFSVTEANTNGLRIYFSISKYNNWNNIKDIHVTITNQNTNISELNSYTYPTGIYIINLPQNNNQTIIPESNNNNMVGVDETKGDYKYYITIPASVLKSAYTNNIFYKIQLRFSSIPLSGPTAQQQLNNSDNLSSFSEWSKVCIVKGISDLSLQLLNFDQGQDNNSFSSTLLDIIGNVSFAQTNEKEHLKTFQIKIYDAITEDLVFDSGDVFTDTYAPNEINYSLPQQLEDGNAYILKIIVTTNNSYSKIFTQKFSILSYGADNLPAAIEATADNINGRIKIKLNSIGNELFMGTFSIRRASSKSNFHKWEDLVNITYNENKPLNEYWEDYTVESGVMYKYGAQKRYPDKTRGTIIKTENPVLCLFEDMFLNDGQRQLKIQFNPIVSDFKYNVTESQQIAIGSQYPYIKRNTKNYYRTFSIGGLISSFIDNTEWQNSSSGPDSCNYTKQVSNNQFFTNKSEVYKESTSLYTIYNQEHKINEYTDYIYEKNFRDKVYEFLYKNNIKLFRSTTEGNILIKLMNIAFQPNDTLGRRLYSFTATAVEIDESTVNNYIKYNILTLDNTFINTYLSTQHTYSDILEINDNILYVDDDGENPPYNESPSNTHYNGFNILLDDGYTNFYIYNLFNFIKNKYEHRLIGFNTYIDKISYLKIIINSEPYVVSIRDDADQLKYELGYLISIQNGTDSSKEIFIKAESAENTETNEQQYWGYLELEGKDLNIQGLTMKCPKNIPISVTLQYDITVTDTEKSDLYPVRTSYIYNPGQIQIYATYGDYTQHLHNLLINKYNVIDDQQRYLSELIGITEVMIEGPNNMLIAIQDLQNSNYDNHILKNGYLNLNEKNTNLKTLIYDLYIKGIVVTKITNLISQNNGTTVEYQLKENEFKEVDVSSNFDNYKQQVPNSSFLEYLKSLNTNLIEEHCCYIGGDSQPKYLYYNNQFYELKQDNDINYIEYPLVATITYCYGLIQKTYE